MTQNGGTAHQPPHEGPAPIAFEPGIQQVSPLEVFWYRRWTIAAVVVGCLAVGFIYLARSVPIYRSTSRIYVEQEAPRLLTGDDVLSTLGSKNYL